MTQLPRSYLRKLNKEYIDCMEIAVKISAITGESAEDAYFLAMQMSTHSVMSIKDMLKQRLYNLFKQTEKLDGDA